MNRKLITCVILAVIVVAGIFVRVWDINNLPPGVYPDEAVNGMDGLQAIEEGEWGWFYENNNGREGLYLNLTGLSLKMFGVSVFALKFWSIVFGSLTIIGVYLLAQEMFQSRKIGLVAAFLIAFSFWHIDFSRIAFRAIMVPFTMSFAFYFLLRGLRLKNYLPFILAGLFYGLGLHTYIAFRVSPLILVLLFISLLLTKKGFLKDYWKQIVVFVVMVVIVSSPMLWDFYKHPEHISSRTNSISVLSPEVNNGDLVGTLKETIGLSLAKYGIEGDPNWRHGYPKYPVLFYIVGLMFWIGLAYGIVKVVHLLRRLIVERQRRLELNKYVLLLSWFGVMLIPEFLTAEGLPHSLRAIGTIPAVYILAALPFGYAFNVMVKKPYKRIAYTFLVAALLFSAGWNVVSYHYSWKNEPQVHSQFNESFMNMATYLNVLPDDTKKYVIANARGQDVGDGFSVSAQVVKLFTYGETEVEYLKEDFDPSKIEGSSKIVLMDYREWIIDRLKEEYPNLAVEEVDLRPGMGSGFTVIDIRE